MKPIIKYDFLPYNKELTARAKELRKNMTAAEKKLWYNYLRTHKYKFTRQKPIDNYIVDFYCSELGIVIEIDGETHLSEKEIKYDSRRTADLKKYGLKIMRFWNDDVLSGTGEIPLYQGDENKENYPPDKGGEGGGK